MTADVREWLPLGAAAHEAVRAKLEATITEWSDAWFAARRVGLASLTPTTGGARAKADGTVWRVHRHSIAVAASRTTSSRLVEWALDARLDQPVLTARDRDLIALFERRVIQDLVRRLEGLLALDADVRDQPIDVADPLGCDGGAMLLLAAEDGTRLMSIAVPTAALLSLLRSVIVPGGRPRARLQDRLGALKPVNVTLEARLGEARLSLAELRELAPGDILVLDAEVSAGADVGLVASDQVFARAGLTEVDGYIGLTLERGLH
ncbi:MAG: FliM/FliN family flagellar motor switch protein [Caulobacterales bacterium]